MQYHCMDFTVAALLISVRKDFILHECVLNKQTRALQLEPQKITAATEQHVMESWMDVLLL